MRLLLLNPTLNIDVTEKKTGVNSFWLASFFGHGKIMRLLAEKGINLLNTHRVTGNNALHIAVEKNYLNIVKMLIKSSFPLEHENKKEQTALSIASIKQELFPIC